MANQLYDVNASPYANTIDILVAQSPVINKGNGMQLDPTFRTAIVDTYKKYFYKPQIKHYGAAYTYPTINVRPQDNKQVTLEDNIDELWHEWVNNEIYSLPLRLEKYSGMRARISIPGRILFAGILRGDEEFLKKYLMIVGLAFMYVTASNFIDQYFQNRGRKDLQMYEALSCSPMRILA